MGICDTFLCILCVWAVVLLTRVLLPTNSILVPWHSGAARRGVDCGCLLCWPLVTLQTDVLLFGQHDADMAALWRLGKQLR